jgi:hypothetical protein
MFDASALARSCCCLLNCSAISRHNVKTLTLSFSLLAAVGLVGCAVAPGYVGPNEVSGATKSLKGSVFPLLKSNSIPSAEKNLSSFVHS